MKDPMPTDIFKIGQVLNNTYEIIGVLGRGGTGEVYLARNQINEREIAIKALNARFSGNEDYVELMKREDQMRAILHDAVVRYVEVSKTDHGHVFLVMDYIEGPSLNDVMLQQRVDDRALLVVAHRVLEGLVPTHAHGIVHRDLSPDNIILRGGDPERATIIDFGIAKDTSAGAMTIVGNEFAGKYEYAAPEQLDGHADQRTDLYALAASLLAAHQREIPHLGSTPAEIVRNKAKPLDTSRVSEPLKELIDWLGAPNPQDRPQSAEEALKRLGEILKPLETPKGERRARKAGKKERGALVPLLLGGLIMIGGVGAWLSGALDELFADPLPIADPYTMNAALTDDNASFSANAPDPETAALLSAAFRNASGTQPAADAVTLAQGMPVDNWPDLADQILAQTKGLLRWHVRLEGVNADISGLAQDRATKAQISARITDWGKKAGVPVTLDLQAGPEKLATRAVQGLLDGLATCGRLSQINAPDETYALYDAIRVGGDLMSDADKKTIQAKLEPEIGDRTVKLETTTLNRDLCAIRAVLPKAPTGNVSISLINGKSEQISLTGVFHTGENPVADILLPETLTEGSLWVMVVDNTGKVFHVLPNINQTVHDIASIGVVENGVRRVRVLWSIEEFLADKTRLAMQVTDGDYGKSEIVAILTRGPLFDIRRPRDESVASVAEALDEAVRSGQTVVVGMASRILDARR